MAEHVPMSTGLNQGVMGLPGLVVLVGGLQEGQVCASVDLMAEHVLMSVGLRQGVLLETGTTVWPPG
jgi:hypothetical protein